MERFTVDGVEYGLQRISYEQYMAETATLLFKNLKDDTEFECYVPISLIMDRLNASIYLEAKIKNLPPDKPLGLKQAENAFISFMRSLGLPDKASMGDVEALCMGMIATNDQANINQALIIAAKALGLIHDIEVAGGKYEGIEFHEGLS